MSLFVQAPESHPFSVHTAMEVFKIKKGNGGKLAASFLVTQDGGAMLFGDEIQPHSASLTITNSGISKAMKQLPGPRLRSLHPFHFNSSSRNSRFKPQYARVTKCLFCFDGSSESEVAAANTASQAIRMKNRKFKLLLQRKRLVLYRCIPNSGQS